MELQPYGPVEQAMQKQIEAEIIKPKGNNRFWWGVAAAILFGGIVWKFVSAYKNKTQRNDEQSQSQL